MRYHKINKELFVRNRTKLNKSLTTKALALVFANDEMPRNGDQTFPYRQNSDFFYLTGLEQEQSILCLCPDHPDKKLREIVFTIHPNTLLETWIGHKYTPDEIREITGIQTVKWLEDFESTLRDLMLTRESVYLNQNEYPKFETEVPSRDLRWARQLKNDYPAHDYQRLAPLLKSLRLVKEPEELELIKKAIHITAEAFQRVLQFTRPGVKEYEVEAEMTHEFIRRGASGHAYPPIVASGQNACTLHYTQNDQLCKEGDLMLLDFGAEYGNYAADCSRTIPVNGKFSPRQKACYEAVLRVQKAAIKHFVPGNTISRVNQAVNQLIEEELIGLGLFTREEVKHQSPEAPLFFNYYMHGTSHFMGLDVHDVGDKETVFQAGMVLSCEPGLYIKEEGIGIRIENDILVAEKPVDLMAAIPREAEEIENLMSLLQHPSTGL